jgi:hypothetical protein
MNTSVALFVLVVIVVLGCIIVVGRSLGMKWLPDGVDPATVVAGLGAALGAAAIIAGLGLVVALLVPPDFFARAMRAGGAKFVIAAQVGLSAVLYAGVARLLYSAFRGRWTDQYHPDAAPDDPYHRARVAPFLRPRESEPAPDGPAPKSVGEAIDRADALLSGEPVPEGDDPRWRAIGAVARYVESEPEAVWSFIRRWGGHPEVDIRDAVADLLEHLLEHHFEVYFPQVEEWALADPRHADTFARCRQFGQSEEPGNAERFEALLARLGKHPQV